MYDPTNSRVGFWSRNIFFNSAPQKTSQKVGFYREEQIGLVAFAVFDAGRLIFTEAREVIRGLSVCDRFGVTGRFISVPPFYKPISSAHKSGFSFLSRSINAMQRTSCITSISTPFEHKSSSAPRKFSFSPIITRGMLKRMVVPVHMIHGLSVETSVSDFQSLLRPAFLIHTISA
jgi:hypothetical protein